METSPEFQDFLLRVSPTTPEEQVEDLLTCFAAVTGQFNRAEMTILRDHLPRTLPDGPARQTLIEIIEGQLALREIQGDV